MDSLSLDLENDTRRDYSIMSATFLEEDLEASLEFMTDMLFHSTLDSYEKEKVRLNGELVMELDSPRNRSHDLFMTELFKNSPYRASHSNILETIPKITSVNPLQEFYKSIYTTNNMLISVSGDINPERVKDQIERYFVGPAGNNRQSENPPTALKIDTDQYLTYAKDDSNQLHVYKGWFAPPLEHPDYPAMVVLNTILGGAGLTSRLFIELRDKQGLAYTVRSQYESSRYAGIFMLYIGTEPSNRDKVLKGSKWSAAS
jgi:predicted Zn-dependent peptidase